MKKITVLILLVITFQSFQCEDDSTAISSVTPEMLAEKKQEILNYISSFSCENASGCNSIAFGAKPCGGPWEYLVYPNSVNQSVLETMVNEYYQMETKFNLETNAVSDCMVVSPPNTIDCVNGTCEIID